MPQQVDSKPKDDSVIRLTLIFLSLLILPTLSIAPENHYAQEQCGFATSINYPVDAGAFTLVQTYAVPSPRHQGRYHTGEDWHLGRNMSTGQPVSAIAAGRVTYSYPLGWGRDGGVVIIQHTMEDGTVFFSQYGHMMETGTIKFPARLSCVEAGQVIGAIGDVRPAPHLHFEIRVANGDTPGPGYSWDFPDVDGWRHPSKFILNFQARTQPAARWQLLTNNALSAPPLQLDDQSLMYVDGDTLRMATYDGRVLWRVPLSKPATAVIGFQRSPLVVYRDGTIEQVDYEGKPVVGWSVEAEPVSAPILTDSSTLFYTADGALVALNENYQEVAWRLDDVLPFVRIQVAREVIGLMTQTGEMLVISQDGKIADESLLRELGSMTTAPDGSLVAFTQAGLWRISADGEWTLAHETAAAVNGSSAVVMAEDGRIFAFDGETLHAYGADGAEQWKLPLTLTGRVEMAHLDSKLVLMSNHGHIVAASDIGIMCGVMRVYGDDQANVWHSFRDDGLLRVGIGDQVIGLDWEVFTRPCRPR